MSRNKLVNKVEDDQPRSNLHTAFRRFRWLLVILILMLVSCESRSLSTSDPDQPAPTLPQHPEPTPMASWTQAWLTADPCHIPCWYGITPGVTTNEAALAILKTLPFIEQRTLHTYDIAGEQGWRWAWIVPVGGMGSLVRNEEKIVKIHLHVYEEIPLDHIIASLGPPVVWTYTDPGLNHQAEITLPLRYSISLGWPSFGLASLGVSDTTPPSLEPHMMLPNDITLLSPDEFHKAGKSWQGYYGYEWYRVAGS